ncbi:MAG: ABC transporter ATP-binding protein [Bacillota bacterium]|nr:ABC transporter ATP-binding protein [Bacillota bacterium]
MGDIIWTEDVNRNFKTGGTAIHVLKDINISVREKSLTVLRGRSGSGKTTLMNIMSTLDKPSGGKVYFDGEEISNLSEEKQDVIRREKMGFIFQSSALISLMTAYENVEFSLRISGYSAKEAKIRAEECLSMVGLSKRMKHMPGELSGGEQQRVAIARAVAHKPKIIFADEPTAELDSQMAFQVMGIFKELVVNQGITILMTTHDPNMMELADEVVKINDGRIVNEKRIVV